MAASTKRPAAPRHVALLAGLVIVILECSSLVSSLVVAFATPSSYVEQQVVPQRLARPGRADLHALHDASSSPGLRIHHPVAKFAGARPVHWGGYRHSEDEASTSVVLAATALAAAVASAGGDEESKASVFKLPITVALWYFFNVQYNLLNKKLLKCFSATWAVSWFQLAGGIPIAVFLWRSGLVRTPKVSRSDIVKLLPVGLAFAVGQACTVASLSVGAVSFTHVVKALEPAINAIASAFVLGQVYHPAVYATLLPIFVGVALASVSELSFTMFGFLAAMMSNFAFVTRNVLATKFGSVGDMGEDKTERKTNQLAVLTIVASVVITPVALALPGGLQSVPAAWNSALAQGVPASRLLYMIIVSAFYFFMYQLSSFWVLSQVPPITHSVLNTLKRCVIIIVSIFVFQTPVSSRSALGTAMAVGGVLLYSFSKQLFKKRS